MQLRAVIFDFDGVLVNSEPLHYRALRDSLLPEGIAIDEDEYQAEYMAYSDRESIRIAFERHRLAFDRPRVEAVAERKAALFETLRKEVPFFPGARDLVGALRAEVPLAIASGALRREIEDILTAGGLRGSFAAVVGADDVRFTKPHPEPYLTALQRLAPLAPGLQPAECAVVEDTVPGILSARAAGMRVVGVAQSYPPAKLAVAHLVVGSLRDLDLAALRAVCD